MKRNALSRARSFAALALCLFAATALAQEEPRPEDKTLLETIKIEAANMEVFPVDLIADSTEGAVYQRPYLEKQREALKTLGVRYGVSKWGEHRELTFDRYLPFYRFKTRVGLATPEEIDECVEAFDSLSAKEKALAITAIFIFERIRRRPLRDENKLTPNGPVGQRFPYAPFYPINPYLYNYVALFLPKYEPNDSIANEKWIEWISTIKSCLKIDEIAFPAIDSPSDNDGENEGRPVFSADGRVLRKDSSSPEWTQNLNRCRELVEEKLGVSLAAFGCDSPNFDKSREFLKKAYELDLDPALSKYSVELALRDYWFTLQNDEFILSMHSGFHRELRKGNGSRFPKTLAEIADQLLASRLVYATNQQSGLLALPR
ncbi:MAG: hypothetical protein IJM30_09855 [Thermoguttaceae bacterium]|nr:hypothetical protein [Thermoguttaceae bacterium]